MARITKVHLLNVPLENDYKNTLYFADKTAQYNYFSSRIVKSYTDFSYQRKDNVIRIPENYDDLQICNYVMYQNEGYSNKWYYAFITEMHYINDEHTQISIETDCMQTWMFDYTIKPSFVEREHVKNDTRYLHTVPEDLDIGIEMVVNDVVSKLYDDFYIIIASNYNPYTNTKYAGMTIYGGVPSGAQWFAFHFNPINLSSDETFIKEWNALVKFITKSAEDGEAESIQSIFAVPKEIIKKYIGENHMVLKSTWLENEFGTETLNVERPSKIAGYTPKNNKLFCFPYSYILGSNNAGSSNIYKFEDFYYFDGDELDLEEMTNNMNHTSDCSFVIHQVPCEGGSITAFPTSYKGNVGNKGFIGNPGEGLVCAKFPTLSWSSDSYTNWLTQNAVNITTSLGTSAIGAVTSLATGAAGGTAGLAMGAVNGISSYFNTITSTLTSIHNANFLPNLSQGNTNAGDVMFSTGQIGFGFYTMSIKPEYALIVDEYFTMFGYKVNRVKIPNVNHRAKFWFTKTIGINIDGAIPNKDMQTIKNCYDNGITFWRNAADINNYAVDNAIIVKE